MKTVLLGDVVTFTNGGTPSRSKQEFWNGSIPWITGADITDDGEVSARSYISQAAVLGSSTNVLPEGTVLLLTRTSVGKVGVLPRPMAINQDITGITPSSAISRRYLVHFLRSSKPRLLTKQRGATIKGVTRDDVASLELALPPLPEQRRIATILDHADALRAKRRQVLTHLDSLTQSIFHDMFGDPFRNPLNFPMATIGSLAEKFSDGPFGSNLKSSHYVSEGVPVVRLQNIGVGQYLDNDRAFIAEDHYSTLSNHDCRPGDILIGTLGEPNLRACIQPNNLPRALNKADCIQFRPAPDLADPIWACWLLNVPGTLALAASLARGQTRTRIAMGRLRNLKVPVPPLDLQRRFAAQAESVNASRDRVLEACSADDKLFASLQSRAFRGEL